MAQTSARDKPTLNRRLSMKLFNAVPPQTLAVLLLLRLPFRAAAQDGQGEEATIGSGALIGIVACVVVLVLVVAVVLSYRYYNRSDRDGGGEVRARDEVELGEKDANNNRRRTITSSAVNREIQAEKDYIEANVTT